MDICGEHGEEIAHTGRDCPACEQIESINKDHYAQVNDLTSDLEDRNAQIDELEAALEEAKNATQST